MLVARRAIDPDKEAFMTVQFSEQLYQSASSYLRPTRLVQGDGFKHPVPLIFSPLSGQCMYATEVVVKGYAVGDICGGIACVELSLDGGQTWMQADVSLDSQPGEWRLWRKQFTLQPGRYALLARARNKMPDAESKWHRVEFEVIP